MKRSIQLVAVKSAPDPDNTRLTLGNYIADVLLDARHNAPIYHWIVQKVGSPSIVHWGQEHTFAEAKSAAQSWLETLNKDQQKKA